MEATKRWAARQGPKVCELEGPMPILKMSRTEMDSCGKWGSLGKGTGLLVLLFSRSGNKNLSCGLPYIAPYHWKILFSRAVVLASCSDLNF